MDKLLISRPIITRFAPTPSGLLHIGNALNFALTWWITRQNGGKIHLRIDDADKERFRPEYLVDIFEGLEWMGLDWDSGPRTPGEFEHKYSQALKTESYFNRLKNSKSLFACDCSRKEIRRLSPEGTYPGTCRVKSLKAIRGETAIRQKTELSSGDYIVWRKDDLPAYHLASLVDDQDLGSNFIFRGKDLEESTIIQKDLEAHIGGDSFKKAKIMHHELLKAPSGEKLSKSKLNSFGPFHLKNYRDQGLGPKDLIRDISEGLGLKGTLPKSFGELLERTPPKGLFKE